MTSKNHLPRIAVLGGDKRQITAAQSLADKGFSVCVFGIGTGNDFHPNVTRYADWKEAVGASGILLLPLPISLDGVRLHMPLSVGETEVRFDVLLDVAEGKTVLGGRLSDTFVRRAEACGVRCIDYFSSEFLQQRNALPTVEGAIEIAMRSLPVTLAGTKMAVVGFGRLGELLSYKLHLLGADVTVYARREEALAKATLYGCSAVKLSENGESALCGMHPMTRVVFQTVPACLLDGETLKKIPPCACLIDLASAPGGIDHVAAERLGIQTVWATSLPGKYAPETAGEIIADTIETILLKEYQP